MDGHVVALVLSAACVNCGRRFELQLRGFTINVSPIVGSMRDRCVAAVVNPPDPRVLSPAPPLAIASRSVSALTGPVAAVSPAAKRPPPSEEAAAALAGMSAEITPPGGESKRCRAGVSPVRSSLNSP
jgi:hypothetical protein